MTIYSAITKWALNHPAQSTSYSGLLLQISRPLVALISVPLLFNALSQSAFGVWLIGLSMIGLVGIVSAGISSSLITQVSRLDLSEGNSQLEQLTTSAVILAIISAAFVIILVLPLVFLVDWMALLKLTDSSLGYETQLLLFSLTMIFSTMIIAIIPRQVMFGLLRGYLAHSLEFFGIVLGLVGLLYAINTNPRLWFIALLFVAPSAVFVFIGGVLYLKSIGVKIFSIQSFSWVTFKKLRKDAIRMSAYQAAFMLSSQTDLILVGVVLGSAATVEFGVAQRVFSFVVMVGLTLNQAQWPAMARADAAGDRVVLLQLFRRTLGLVPLGSGVLALVLVMTYDNLVTLWLGEAIDTDPLIIWGMVAWVCVATVTNTCDSLLRARNETSFLMRAMVVMALLNLFLTLVLLQFIGAAGAIWGSVISYFVVLVLPYLWHLRRDILGR